MIHSAREVGLLGLGFGLEGVRCVGFGLLFVQERYLNSG